MATLLSLLTNDDLSALAAIGYETPVETLEAAKLPSLDIQVEHPDSELDRWTLAELATRGDQVIIR